MSDLPRNEETPEDFEDPTWIFRHGAGTPEQLLEDIWPYLNMTPEERDLECQSVCRTAMRQWRSLPPEVRERIEWLDEYDKRDGMRIIASWARENRERARRAD